MDIHGTFQMSGNTTIIDGLEYMVIQVVNPMKVELNGFNAQLTGLFPDPDLNAFLVEFINQNWRALYQPFLTSTKMAWAPIFLGIANKIFKQVPYNILLPP